MYLKNIEKFFLTTFLKITVTGLSIILISNLIFYPEDFLSIITTSGILLALITGIFIQNKFPIATVILITSIALIAMTYQKLVAPQITTTLSVVLIIGFIVSIMLKGKVMWIMHSITFLILNTIFILHLNDKVTAAITYSVLYFIITYSSGILKFNYDKIHFYLKETNVELNEKAKEIEAQNEELLQIQDNLNEVNNELENIVAERTRKITSQNEILLKYSYTNAHHLRGPVARLLGLANVYRLENEPDNNFFIEKMAGEAVEIDLVVKRINEDLESNPIDRM